MVVVEMVNCVATIRLQAEKLALRAAHSVVIKPIAPCSSKNRFRFRGN